MLPKKIGLLSGKGEFPILIAKELKKQKNLVFAAGFIDITDKEIEGIVDSMKWEKLCVLEPIVEYFKNENIAEVIMAGLIKHRNIFNNIVFDGLGKDIFAKVKDNRADSILSVVAQEFSKKGIEFISPIDILKNHVAGKGVITERLPAKTEIEDIEFGFDAAKHVAGFDIGQTVVVKNKSIIAVEAMEGTDECIHRAGELAGENVVIVKVSKPNQDWRFDVPVVGIKTIEIMKEIGSRVLALEAEKTIIVNKDEVIKKANNYNITIYGI